MRPNDYQINTNYPIDKIVFLKELSFKLDDNGLFEQKVAHGLQSIPFSNAVISFDNWQTTYQAGTSRMARQYYSEEFNVYSDNTNVTVSGMFSEHTGENALVRMWGVFDSTTDATANPTRQLSNNKFVLNSRYNYLKLVKDGIIDVSDGVNREIKHGFGYMPIVELWAESAYDNLGFRYYNRPDVFDSSDLVGQAFCVTRDKLIFRTGGDVLKIKRFYYRMYADEA